MEHTGKGIKRDQSANCGHMTDLVNHGFQTHLKPWLYLEKGSQLTIFQRDKLIQACDDISSLAVWTH